MDKTKLIILFSGTVLMVILSCKDISSDISNIKLTRNKVVQNYFEGNFPLEDNKYFLSIWDSNKNNYFQDKNVDIVTIRNESNKLFIADTLIKTSSIIINNRSYTLQQINDSLINLTPISIIHSDSINQFIINDTISNITLHHFNNDSTSFLYDIVQDARCDSILIYIWETQCPPCRSDIDKFSKIESKYLKIIHLCLSDNAEDAYELMAKKSYKPFFDGYIDVSDKSKIYCIGFPTKFYINKNKYITKYFF